MQDVQFASADPPPLDLPALAPGPEVRLRLIGPMDARRLTGENALPRGRRARALLAFLALAMPRPVQRARLIALLWPGRGEDQARASLRQSLHELTEVLGPGAAAMIVAGRDAIALRDGAVWTDIFELEQAGPQAGAALSLLTGEVLEDLAGLTPAFDAWLDELRRRVAQRARALAESVLASQAEGTASLRAAQRLIAIDPTHEGAWRASMRAHALAGERTRALQAFQDCARILAERLSTQPSAETRALMEAIRREQPEAPAEAPAGDPAPARPVAEPTAPASRPPARGARLGVAPLRALGGAEADAHLSLGLAEEIATALARFRWIPLVAPQSLTWLAGAEGEPALLRGRLGLDLLLAGTVQRAGGKVRVSLTLSDLRAGAEVVWSQRFDRAADDILALQDEIAAEVVARIDPELLLIEARRAAARPVRDAAAYDLLLRAIPAIYRLEEAGFREAGQWLEEAVAREPGYAAAHAWFAFWHVFLVGQGWADDPQAAMARAGSLAERAVSLDPRDARGLAIAGHVRAFLHRRIDQAIALHERALALNPNLPMAWVFSGLAHAYAGRHEEALARIARHARLSPMDPYAHLYQGMAMVPHLLLGQDEAVVALGRAATEAHPMLSAHYRPYLAALGHLGLDEEAAAARTRFLALEPGFTIAGFLAAAPYVRAEDRARFAEGLRRAGLPEQGGWRATPSASPRMA